MLGGDDAFISPLLALGAHGGILASAHVATAGSPSWSHAWRAGDTARARALGHRLAALSGGAVRRAQPHGDQGVLHAQGRIPTAAVRLPLLPAEPDVVQSALSLVDQFAGYARSGAP